MVEFKKKLTIYGLLAATLFGIIIGCVRMFEAPAAVRPRVGFMMRPLINSSNWATNQYNGIRLAASQMGVELLVRQEVPFQEKDSLETVQEFIDAGCEVIILANSDHAKLVQKLIDANPQIAFYSPQTELKKENLCFFSGRFYEAKYLSGMLAAMKSDTGRLGYVASMPIGETIRGINAFALGAQSVRKDAVVEVYWTKAWVREDEECLGVEVLRGRGADVIAHNLDRSTVNEMASSLDVYSIAYHDKPPFTTPFVLANIRIQWGEIYQEVLQRAFKKPKYRNVWLGVSDDAVGCDNFSNKVSSLDMERIRQARTAMIQGRKVFAGEIIDTQGQTRCHKGQSLSDETILRQMNWFVKGVITNL